MSKEQLINEGQYKGSFIALGKQGSGKTAMVVRLMILNRDGRKLFSNTTIKDIPFERITLKPLDYFLEKKLRDKKKEQQGYYATDSELELYNKGLVINVIEKLRDDINYFNNSVMILDEIQVYLDSRDFMNRYHRLVQTFFSQLRKRNILVLSTSQDLLNIDVRIRRQTLDVFEMKPENKEYFKVTTYDIDGYYLSEPTTIYYVDLRDYFKYYDTNEVIV